MRLRTLPLSLAGVLCGGSLAMGRYGSSVWTIALVALTAGMLQVLSNLSNEMGDYLNGVDDEKRQGPAYGMAAGLTERQLWRAININVVLCTLSGLLMLLFSFQFSIFNFQFSILLVLGAAAIWAATHYTLGKKPYGYVGLGDLFVFIFFGLVSVLGSYFVMAHTIDFKPWLLLPAVGMGLLSIGVLNVNNIRDMESDKGVRHTVPIRIGERGAKWYQTILVTLGTVCFLVYLPAPFLTMFWFLFAIPVVGMGIHIAIVWRSKGKALDPALPLLVFSTFFIAIIYSIIMYGIA